MKSCRDRECVSVCRKRSLRLQNFSSVLWAQGNLRELLPPIWIPTACWRLWLPLSQVHLVVGISMNTSPQCSGVFVLLLLPCQTSPQYMGFGLFQYPKSLILQSTTWDGKTVFDNDCAAISSINLSLIILVFKNNECKRILKSWMSLEM